MDWREIASPLLLGILHCEVTRGKEIFSFEASAEWAAHPCHAKLDPDFSDYGGIQYPSGSKQNFGLFLDSSPDRWGRLLIKRREAVMSRIENRPRRHLTESDFLLGVYDNTRMGAGGRRFESFHPDTQKAVDNQANKNVSGFYLAQISALR